MTTQNVTTIKLLSVEKDIFNNCIFILKEDNLIKCKNDNDEAIFLLTNDLYKSFPFDINLREFFHLF